MDGGRMGGIDLMVVRLWIVDGGGMGGRDLMVV